MPAPQMTPKAQKAYDEALRRIEECRKKGKQGTVLDLSGLGLTILPPEIGQLTALVGLHLADNELTTLPPEIGQLTALTGLYLHGNPGLGLAADMLGPTWRNSSATNPRAQPRRIIDAFLKLQRSRPTSPPQATSISENVRSTPSTPYDRALRLIEEHGRLGKQQGVLNLTGFGLSKLPPEIGQLTTLTGLVLDNNQLTLLPPEIGQLKGLRRLDIFNNQLLALPPEVGQCRMLTRLSLSNNQLTTLPPEINQFTALTELDLSNNQLATLPAEIGQLKVLTELCLQNNQLATLPSEIGQLTALTKLFLHGNPGLGMPDDALGPPAEEMWRSRTQPKPPQEILNYYFDIKQGGGEALRELRVIVVGHPKAGKTSLIRRLNDEAMNPNEAETHGINISAMKFQCADGPMQARLWDFGGQHVLHAMHEFFLTKRCLYLLVLEQRTDRTDKDAKYWLQLIRSYAGEAPVVIALNQSGGVERPWSRTELERDNGPFLDVVPTECAPQSEKNPNANASIAALRAALTKAMDAMTEPRQKFPRKWSGIKRWLEEMKEPFLDYAEFTRRCAADEPNATKQAELAALMNDLGIAMNYARDPRLRDTTVLRPDWLANGIYAILRANMLSSERLVPDGVLSMESLGLIYATAERAGMLTAAEYPEEKYPFLLRLMGLFRLSFPLDTEDREHLVPALLLPDESPGSEEPADTNRVRLRYDFDVVPAPLIGRFIVVLFPLVERGRAWQRGACLRYGTARARVWLDLNEDKIWVTVGGPDAADRDELLGLIRETMRRMRTEYHELRMDEHREMGRHFLPHAFLEETGKVPPDPATPSCGEIKSKPRRRPRKTVAHMANARVHADTTNHGEDAP